MSIVDDIVTGPPFWDDDLVPPVRVRINGEREHHCDICPVKDGEICNITCSSVRKDIKDGVEVTY